MLHTDNRHCNISHLTLSDAQTDAETISRLIKERITPYPSFVLAPERENGKDILVLSVSSGRSTPYYYKADGIMEAYLSFSFLLLDRLLPISSREMVETNIREAGEIFGFTVLTNCVSLVIIILAQAKQKHKRFRYAKYKFK